MDHRPTSTQPQPIAHLDVDDAARRLREGGSGGALLVDVREADELTVVRVPGAVHVPLSNFAEASRALPADRELLLFCASGRRSLVAAEFLQRHGHVQVANIVGGIIEWHKRGLPTLSGPLTPDELGRRG